LRGLFEDLKISCSCDEDEDEYLIDTREFGCVDVPAGGGDGSYWEEVGSDDLMVSDAVKLEFEEKVKEIVAKLKEVGIEVDVEKFIGGAGLYLVGM